jgi:hypothetical protein
VLGLVLCDALAVCFSGLSRHLVSCVSESHGQEGSYYLLSLYKANAIYFLIAYELLPSFVNQILVGERTG